MCGCGSSHEQHACLAFGRCAFMAHCTVVLNTGLCMILERGLHNNKRIPLVSASSKGQKLCSRLCSPVYKVLQGLPS